jgi:hypothetical protein
MARKHTVATAGDGPGDDATFTAAEDAEWEAYEAVSALEALEERRGDKYAAANAEYVKRGVALTGAKIRGASAEQALTAVAMKETQRGGPNASPLAALHDKLDALKDLIEAAPDRVALNAIDVTAAGHWT